MPQAIGLHQEDDHCPVSVKRSMPQGLPFVGWEAALRLYILDLGENGGTSLGGFSSLTSLILKEDRAESPITREAETRSPFRAGVRTKISDIQTGDLLGSGERTGSPFMGLDESLTGN